MLTCKLSFVTYIGVLPSRNYGLPKPDSGCPDGEGVVWREGQRKQYMEDDRWQGSNFSQNFHMEASLKDDYINRTFCIGHNPKRNIFWPKGIVCKYLKNIYESWLDQ